jgi:hypothetical protein
MAIVTLLNVADDNMLAARIREDLTAAGHEITDTVQAGAKHVTVVVLSPAALNDKAIKDGIAATLDNYQHVLPVIAREVELPRLIDHLQPLDFSRGYDRDALLDQVATLTGPNAPRPMTVLTPAQRRANRRAGYFVVGLVLFIFFVSVYVLATGIVGVPEDEFASVETQIYLTRNAFIDEALPFTTSEALSFEATVEEARPSVQPFLILTATANAAGVENTFVPRSSEEATGFPETLEHVSTVVHDRLMATVTLNAATAAAITPTPSPSLTP